MSTMESYLVTELCTACTRGDLDTVKKFIELGTSPWTRDDQGNTLFHLCCSSIQCGLEVLEYLISISGIVNCGSLVNKESSTLLHLACIAGKLEFVRFLCVHQQDAFKSCHDIHGHTPLYYACINQHLDIVSFVCSQDIVLSPNNIYQCVKVSTWEIMKLLLKKISFRNFMDRVIEENHMALANLVIKDNFVQWLDGKVLFPLHYSASLGDVKVVKFLLNNIKYNIEGIDNVGNRPLHLACFSGNVELVRYLVEKLGCDINAMGNNDYTSLHWACEKIHLEIVKFLTSIPECNCETCDKNDNRPLHIACLFSGNVELVRYLVEEAGCDINAKGQNDYTSIHIACAKNQLEIVKFLTSKPECSRQSANNLGNLPLHLACSFFGNVELARYLVEEAGCDINAKGQNDYTSLHFACEKNQLEIVKFLTSKPECNREAGDKDGDRPLNLACGFSGNVELVRYLVEEAGCDINAKGQSDYTSLHWACHKNQLEIAKFLTSKPECSHEAGDKFGNLPLHLACGFSGNVELVRYLVEEAGCDINAKGSNDYTSLHWACEKNQLEIVKLLASKPECNRECPDKFGNLPFHLACGFSGNVELVRYLVEEAGCDINAKGQSDYTSLHWACHKNQLEIAKFLTSKPECSHEAEDKYGNRPLHIAYMFSDNVELVKYLVKEAGCDINAKGENDYTSLHFACKKNQLEIVKFLTSKPECNREAEDKYGNRPLHIAYMFSDNVELVKYLVKEAGCDINAKGENDYTSLHFACKKNQLEIVKFLTSKPECNREAEDKYGNRPLHIAYMFSDNVELVKYLVKEAGCDINAKGQSDYTSLHWACYKNQLEIVKFLTSKPECNREAEDKYGNRPLHIAYMFSDNVELVKYLVKEAGCDINAKGENDYTSLHFACKKNQLEIVKFLTSKPECNCEAEDKYGNRPLHIAYMFSDNVELVKYLVKEAGCDINAKGENDYTSLHFACKKNQLEIVKFLTSKPECNREAEDKYGNRPLHIAYMFSGNVELVKYLVKEAGCDINAKGQSDYTSLHWACYKNQLEIVKFLTSKPECNCEAEDINGNRPLHIAYMFSDNVELVKYLVKEAGCDINAKGENYYTSLHFACKKNQLEIVKFLTSKPECNCETEDIYGNRPLHVACMFSGNVELVRYLVKEAGCDINAKGENDYTALHWACEKNQLEIVKFLTSKQECSLEAGDKDGNRPLHLACGFSGNVGLVRYLVEVVGCDINSKTVNGKFPLQIALDENNFDLVKYLTTRPECHTVALNCNDYRLQRLVDHHNKFQQAIKSTGVTYLRVVKCILTGPPGAGKSTLKKRLLNESLVEPSHSTGVVDSAIQVESFRKLQQEGAIVSGLNENFSKWRKQDSAEEAVYLFERISTNSSGPFNSGTNITNQSELTKKSIKIEPIEEIYDTIEHNTQRIERTELIEEITISSDIQHSTVCNLEVPEIHNESDSNEVIILEDDNDDDNINTDRMTFQDTSNNSESYVAPNVKAIQTLSETVQSIPVTKRTEYEKRLQQVCEVSHAILHIVDTGGQPEFHEILPALITGPAINLLVFKLTEDLRSRFKITYRSPNGESQPYETSFTHEEVIFRSLASIACLRQNTIGWTFDELPIKDDSEPAAFLIATHRDCVDESKVAEVNKQLKLKIQNSVELFYKNLIQFLNEEQAIFPLDTINDHEQIEHLRTTLHNVISNKFSELPIPISWCTFSIKLRKSKKSLHKLDTCYKLAKECGISDQNDFKSALWYLHHRVGSIMHYPEVTGLEDIVITDLQLVFDRITQLITSSFTFEATGNAAIVKEFNNTGQFTESYLRTLSSRKGDPLTPLRLVNLLKHLHIVACPMELKHGHRKDKYYFMPCALKPTSVEEEHQDQLMSPAPLLIYFECGYNPVGVFCCLVVHLLSSTSQTEVKWTLEKPPHYRNKIIFTVGECCDHITLISRATYLEVWIDRVSGTTGAIPLEQLCPTIYNTLDNGIKVITGSLHYSYKSQHFFGFPCTACQSSPPHPVICKSSHPVVAQCVNGRVRIPLEEKHKIWFNKVSLSNKCKIIIILFVIGYHIIN